MSNKLADTTLPLTDDDIVQYLCQHKDFFIRNPSLLADLKLPHQTGGAISLVEKQVSILRERNNEFQQRLQSLVDNARRNDVLFEKTKRLILNLLEAKDINDLIDALLYSFDNDFEIEFTSLILFTEDNRQTILSGNDKVQQMPVETAQTILGTIISNNKTICGQLDIQEQQLLFQDTDIGSTAIAPLAFGKPLGVLAIANSDTDYYRSSMSTLFLSYIADILNRLLQQHVSSQ